jgi:site-specific DNA-methyltransferase (adenine-specific)
LPYGSTACSWDTIIPFEPLWEQYKRIIKDNGAIVLTASQPFTSALVMSNPKMFKYCWVWNKKISGNPLIAKHQPLKIHEDICVFSDGKHKYYPEMRKGKMRTKGGGKSNLLNMDMAKSKNDDYYPVSILEFSNAKRGIHPTQKPVALFEYLIKTYTNEGDLVLDNAAGSGTTGVAAKNLKRNFILIEKEPKYVEIARERIKNMPTKLF